MVGSARVSVVIAHTLRRSSISTHSGGPPTGASQRGCFCTAPPFRHHFSYDTYQRGHSSNLQRGASDVPLHVKHHRVGLSAHHTFSDAPPSRRRRRVPFPRARHHPCLGKESTRLTPRTRPHAHSKFLTGTSYHPPSRALDS